MLHSPEKKVDVVAEESKQTQVSSQPKTEEVKQVPSKEEQSTSPQRNTVITGKLVSRLNKLIYQNYLTFGRRDSHGLSIFTCVVLGD